MRQSSFMSTYDLRVRKVYNWLGSTELMIELYGLEECVGFGDTFLEAKKTYLRVSNDGNKHLDWIVFQHPLIDHN